MTFGGWRRLVGILCAGCLPLVPVAPAQAQGVAPDPVQVPSPVLILDQERLFDGSQVAERISAEIEQRSRELAAENRAIEAQLVAEELDLTERRASLSPDAFRTLADAFDEKVQRFRAEQDAKTRELQRLRDQERQNFLRRITPVLAEIVRERGAVAVLDRRSVFLSAESIDITEEAIKRINDAFGDGSQTDEAPPPDPDDPAHADPLLPGTASDPVGDGNPENRP